MYGCFDVKNKVDSIFLDGLWCPKGTIKFYGDGALKNVPFSRTFSLHADVTLKIRQMGNAVPSSEKGLREEKIPWGEADRVMHFNKITYRNVDAQFYIDVYLRTVFKF